jgi:hypothetical protein
MQTVSSSTSLYLAGKENQIKYTLSISDLDYTPVKINLYVCMWGGTTKVIKTLTPSSSDGTYSATFDINNVLWGELLKLSTSRYFAFPGDPDTPMIDRTILMMLPFYLDWSYYYVDDDGDLQEASYTDNSSGDTWYAIQGGLSQVMQYYLSNNADQTFLEWLNVDTSALKFWSWIPDDMQVHPSQPMRIWFYNDSKMDSITLMAEATFTDGTTQEEEIATLECSFGLIEIICGPEELRLSTFDISKTVASYKIWLSGIKTVEEEDAEFDFQLTTVKDQDSSYASFALAIALETSQVDIKVKYEARISVDVSGNDYGEGFGIASATTNGTSLVKNNYQELTEEWQEFTSEELSGTISEIRFAVGNSDTDVNITLYTGTVIELRNITIIDAETEDEISVDYAYDLTDYDTNWDIVVGTEDESVIDTSFATEEKSFIIDYTDYERNDILFFKTSLGVNEVLWCHGRRSETLTTEIEERTQTLATNALGDGTIRAYRGTLEYPFNMNTGWFKKSIRHYLADFLAAGEAKLPVQYFYMPVTIKPEKYDWGEDGKDLFACSFTVQLAHIENYYSPIPEVESEWGSFNDDFNEDFF